MTREEVNMTIDYLKEMQESYIEGEGYERHPLPEWYALDMAIKALEQESCEDAISRQAVLKIYNEWFNSCNIANKKESPKAQINALPSVQPKSGWIPVSEKLPEKGGDYLVTTKWKGSYSGDVYTETNMAVYREKEKEWDCAKVIAWQPLPEPYEPSN